VLSSDQVVHDLYLRADVRDTVAERFGVQVLDPDGAIDRRAVAEIVFADPAALRELELLLHPLVAEEAERFRREAEAAGAAIAVQEVPLLFEREADDRYDRTVLITAPDELRRARDPERFDRRRVHQLADEEKRALADEVFVNDGDVAALDLWVAGLVRRLSA
jgi:dephospho-CoA kinase